MIKTPVWRKDKEGNLWGLDAEDANLDFSPITFKEALIDPSGVDWKTRSLSIIRSFIEKCINDDSIPAIMAFDLISAMTEQLLDYPEYATAILDVWAVKSVGGNFKARQLREMNTDQIAITLRPDTLDKTQIKQLDRYRVSFKRMSQLIEKAASPEIIYEEGYWSQSDGSEVYSNIEKSFLSEDANSGMNTLGMISAALRDFGENHIVSKKINDQMLFMLPSLVERHLAKCGFKSLEAYRLKSKNQSLTDFQREHIVRLLSHLFPELSSRPVLAEKSERIFAEGGLYAVKQLVDESHSTSPVLDQGFL